MHAIPKSVEVIGKQNSTVVITVCLTFAKYPYLK